MRRIAILGLIVVAAGFFQAWFMGLSPSSIATRHSNGGLYDAYTQALASEQSYLPAEPEGPSLLANRKYGILDASYYLDRIYIYFGLTPFAILAVPWYKVTGTFLSEGTCILVFEQVGYLMYGFSLIILVRHDRRSRMDYVLAAAFLTTIVASGTWSLMARPAIYEIEGACGYACFASAVACLVAANGFKQRTKLLLGSAAFFAGITIGIRPNYAPAVALTAIAIAYLSWTSGTSVPEKIKALILCSAPLVSVGIVLGAWNYVRFSNIFEFGYGYTEFAQNNPDAVHFSHDNLLYNFQRYLLGGFRLGHYFPFIDGAKDGPFGLPKDMRNIPDQIYGSLILFPVLAFACFALFKRQAFTALLLAGAAGNLFLLSGLGFGTYRYPADYLGILSFVAALGICSATRSANCLTRAAAVILLIPAVFWSIICSVCQAASISRTSNLFDIERRVDFDRLASPFNAVAYLFESFGHTGPKIVRINLMFPNGKFGNVEPILVSGEAGLQDFVYFYYIAPGQIQVGFESTGHGGLVSASREIDYSRSHVVEISLGSFLPPDDHPLLRTLHSEDRAIARHYIHVEIDKRSVLEGEVRFHQTRSRILIGSSPDDPAFGARFSGKLLEIERPLYNEVGIFPKWRPSLFGPVSIVLLLEPFRLGTKQPLLSVGNRPAGAELFVEHLTSDKIRFGWENYNGTPAYSAPIDYSFGRPHKIEFSVGSLFPPLTSDIWPASTQLAKRVIIKQMMSCKLDDAEVWHVNQEAPDVSPSSIVVGQNSLLLSNISDSLEADITSVKREAW
jgi:hypothetical protein